VGLERYGDPMIKRHRPWPLSLVKIFTSGADGGDAADRRLHRGLVS
jgi:hypothetical protein